MKDLEWSRTEQAKRVREQIWQHVSPASVATEGVLPFAQALMQLPGRDLRLLRSLHLLISPETADLVAAAPGLARQLRSSTIAVLEQHPERVRGPIDWAATLSASAAQGRRYVFATRPPERDYSTPENRLLLAALEAVVDARRTLRWGASKEELSQEIARRGDVAATVLGSPTLHRVIPSPEARDSERVERGRAARRFAPVTRFWHLRDRLERLQDLTLLRSMVERTALLASSDGALLEVLVLFDVLDALAERGWSRVEHGLIQGQAQVLHRRGQETLVVRYQGVPAGLRGRYERVLRSHGLPASVLRPDLTLDRWRTGGRREIAIIEVKYRRRAADAVRASLGDLLAYRDNYAETQARVRLAGVGWGLGLDPRPGADVLLCTPDRILQLVALLDD